MLFLISIIYLTIFGFILPLNHLIFVINGIILLNVLFVVGYYLYNLLKNPIFWEELKKFILLCIISLIILILVYISLTIINLVILGSEVYALSPEPLGDYVQDIQEHLRDLQQNFVAKRTDLYYQKMTFDRKVNDFSQNFNNLISHVECANGKAVPQFKFPSESLGANDAREDELVAIFNKNSRNIKDEARIMLDKVSELQAIDARIHSISQVNFDNKEYQNLTNHFLQYRNLQWLGIKHPDKILTGMNLTNRYF